jgi:hypothetical protein
MIGGRAADAVEQLAASVDALLALPRDPDTSGELIRAVEVQRRRLEAVDQQLIADVLTAGQRDALPVLLCADPAEVRARVKRSGGFGSAAGGDRGAVGTDPAHDGRRGGPG